MARIYTGEMRNSETMIRNGRLITTTKKSSRGSSRSPSGLSISLMRWLRSSDRTWTCHGFDGGARTRPAEHGDDLGAPCRVLSGRLRVSRPFAGRVPSEVRGTEGRRKSSTRPRRPSTRSRSTSTTVTVHVFTCSPVHVRLGSSGSIRSQIVHETVHGRSSISIKH